jgi:hypothetical protein
MAASDKSSEVPQTWLNHASARNVNFAGLGVSGPEYIRNMATLVKGRDPTNEEMLETAETLGYKVERQIPPYIQRLKEAKSLHLLVKASEEEILKNEALELVEDDEQEDLPNSKFLKENQELQVKNIILTQMKLYKEKNNMHMVFHLMYNQEIKVDVEEHIFKDLDIEILFQCRCITSKGQIHYHAMVEQTKGIRSNYALLYHFKKQRAISKWPVKSYQITHMKSDHHFVNSCMYMCFIKANRDHGPHSERLFQLTPEGGERVWESVANVYENLYKERYEANMAYHLKMKKSYGNKMKKIIVNNV